jgi:undecaprenol kinase/diacylglycerol kinase (ATP)
MKAFLNRVRFAFQGVVVFFSVEKNGQVQGVIAILAIIDGFALSISVTEWMVLLSCIGVVVSLEMINSAIEKICDHVNPHLHPNIKVIKDIAAGAVLWTAITAAIIGLIIFLPKLFVLLT